MTRFTITAVLAFFALAPIYVRADFEDLGMGARATAMGDAMTGLADDNSAIYYNPAGLAWLRRSQLTADYTRLNIGLSDKSSLALGFVSYVHPLFKIEKPARSSGINTSTAPVRKTLIVEGATITLSLPIMLDERYSKPRIPPYGTLGVALRTFDLAGAYHESTYYLSYAHTALTRLNWGVSLKFLQEKYEQDGYTQIDPVFAAKTGVSAVSGDLGIQWNYRACFFWGASILDVMRPDVGLKSAEKLPSTFKTGFGYKNNKNAAVLDLSSRDSKTRVGVGGEHWSSRNTLGMRMGLDAGEKSQFNLGIGFSYRISALQLDYGFLFPVTGPSGTAGTHRLSFTYRMGRPNKDEIEPGSLEASYSIVKDENTSLEKRLKAAEEERDKLEKVLVDEATSRMRERISQANGRGASGAASVPVLTHYTHAGDTLMGLAEKYYGDAKRWKEIYEVNRDKVGRGGRLKPGALLTIPGKTVYSSITPAVPEAPKAVEPTAVSSATVVSSTPTVSAVPPAKPKVTAPVKVPKPEPAVKTQKFHTVKSGETLNSIAQKYYGDAKRWVDIYKANKSKISRGAVEAGQSLLIP